MENRAAAGGDAVARGLCRRCRREHKDPISQFHRQKHRQDFQSLPSTMCRIGMATNSRWPASIVIHLDEQKAYFYKRKQLAGISWISTGREGLETPTGHFHIIQKDKDHVFWQDGNYLDEGDGNISSNTKADCNGGPDAEAGTTYDGDVMPFFMRIVAGTGLHEGYLPGYPASHGCIRMPGFMAENFFYNVESRTPVTIASASRVAPINRVVTRSHRKGSEGAAGFQPRH